MTTPGMVPAAHQLSEYQANGHAHCRYNSSPKKEKFFIYNMFVRYDQVAWI